MKIEWGRKIEEARERERERGDQERWKKKKSIDGKVEDDSSFGSLICS